jgi:hypothetical protein
MENKLKILKLNHVLKFGKYKGFSVFETIEGDYIGDFRGIDYLCWLIDNTDYRLDSEGLEMLLKKTTELNDLGFYGTYEIDFFTRK